MSTRLDLAHVVELRDRMLAYGDDSNVEVDALGGGVIAVDFYVGESRQRVAHGRMGPLGDMWSLVEDQVSA